MTIVENAAGAPFPPFDFNPLSPDRPSGQSCAALRRVRRDAMNLSTRYSSVSGQAWRSRVMLALAVIGPGFITANVDNDAGGKDAADAAQALRPLAGEYAYLLFAGGLFNASLFAASILPISTAYAVCEGLGLESGLDKTFAEAPIFYWLYSALIVFGAGVVLVPRFPLFRVMVLSQVANGVLLPFVLIFVLLLINDKELMGSYVNSKWYNVVSWTTVGVMMALTIAMVIAQLRG